MDRMNQTEGTSSARDRGVECAGTAAPQPVATDIFSDPEAFFALAAAAFQEAVSDAIAENDRLGIAGVGAVNGQIVIRQPPVSARS